MEYYSWLTGWHRVQVVVLDERTVLHVGMPSVKLMPLERLLLPQRQPVVRFWKKFMYCRLEFVYSLTCCVCFCRFCACQCLRQSCNYFFVALGNWSGANMMLQGDCGY